MFEWLKRLFTQSRVQQRAWLNRGDISGRKDTATPGHVNCKCTREAAGVQKPAIYRDFVNCYVRDSWVQVCVVSIVREIAGTGFVIERNGKAVSADHPAARLLVREWVKLLVSTVIDLELTGNAYWVKTRSAEGTITGLTWLPSKDVRIVPNGISIGGVGCYYYEESSGKRQAFDPAEIVHFRYSNPASTYYGLGSVEPIADVIYQYRMIEKRIEEALRDPYLWAAILEAPGQLSAEQLKMIERRWFEAHGSAANNKPLRVVGDDLTLKDTTAEVLGKLMEKEEGLRDQILAGFGVPEGLVGNTGETPVLRGEGKEGDVISRKEVRREFRERVIEGKLGVIEKTITAEVLGEMEEGLSGMFISLEAKEYSHEGTKTQKEGKEREENLTGLQDREEGQEKEGREGRRREDRQDRERRKHGGEGKERGKLPKDAGGEITLEDSYLLKVLRDYLTAKDAQRITEIEDQKVRLDCRHAIEMVRQADANDKRIEEIEKQKARLDRQLMAAQNELVRKERAIGKLLRGWKIRGEKIHRLRAELAELKKVRAK